MKFQKHSLKSKKLTKKCFMGLRSGGFLVGNVCDSLYPPAFGEIIAPKKERELQWKRIIAAGANGRLCDIFKDRGAFEKYRKKRHSSASHHGYKH